MKKSLTLKITGLMLGVVTLLQIIPVYAEGSQSTSNATFYQTAEQYNVSIEGFLADHPVIEKKKLYAGNEVMVPDVMQNSPVANLTVDEQGKKSETATVTTNAKNEAKDNAKAQAATSKAAAASVAAAAPKSQTSKVKAASTTAEKAASNTVTVAGRDMTYTDKLDMRATAYTADPSENGWGAVDALGNPLRLGTVAVDPDVIPLGTKLFVTGYQFSHLPGGGFVATASDTGGTIKGNKIDIFVPVSKSTGDEFGIQDVQVYVLK
ncbi:3D domain-containing protein [Paenibacillus marinisediminis]